MNNVLSDLARKGMLADPGDHFMGRHEVELKFAVDNIERIRDTISGLGAIPFVLGNEETDIFLDWPDGRLAKNGQSQVLREMRPSGRVLWISKGPGKDECVAMDLPEFGSALKMLLSIGFQQTSSITKRRDIYFLGAHHVTLDDVEGLGMFAEVAAMTDNEASLGGLRAAVQQTAEAIGLSQAALVDTSYRELLANVPPSR